MDSDKLGDKSTIGIPDLTRVNQASHTINKQVKEQTGTMRSKVAVYIATAIQAFVKDGKTLIKFPYFFK
jgi:hypothetical protein